MCDGEGAGHTRTPDYRQCFVFSPKLQSHRCPPYSYLFHCALVSSAFSVSITFSNKKALERGHGCVEYAVFGLRFKGLLSVC